jgi:hypothetical protein
VCGGAFGFMLILHSMLPDCPCRNEQCRVPSGGVDITLHPDEASISTRITKIETLEAYVMVWRQVKEA